MCRRNLLLALLGTAACGGIDDALQESQSAMYGDNGLSPNGLGRNGLGRNGFVINGLGRNGLGRNGYVGADGRALGLFDVESPSDSPSPSASPYGAPYDPAQQALDAWFGADVALADHVMKYAVGCACPEGVTLGKTWNGTRYTWSGQLARAPEFCSGRPLLGSEKRAFSACMAALVNPSRQSVLVSLRSAGIASPERDDTWNDRGTILPAWRHEGAFFGNLSPEPSDDASPMSVDEERIYACYGTGNALQTLLHSNIIVPQPVHHTNRSCTRGWDVATGYPCLPIINVGSCWDVCTGMDDNGAYQECRIGAPGRERYYRGAEVMTVFMHATDYGTSRRGQCSGSRCDQSPASTWRAPASFCGDGICNGGEDSASCEADCLSCTDVIARLATPPAVTIGNRAGGTRTIDVPLNLALDRACKWSAGSDAPWLTVDPSLKYGAGKIAFQFTPNPTCEDRSATIDIDGVSRITVTQVRASGCPQ